jgi:hypothetical protein
MTQTALDRPDEALPMTGGKTPADGPKRKKMTKRFLFLMSMAVLVPLVSGCGEGRYSIRLCEG